MKHSLFLIVLPYGEHELEYCIDDAGTPVLVEKHENHQSFLRQKDILDWRLKREKISQEEYDERLHELIEKTGEYEE